MRMDKVNEMINLNMENIRASQTDPASTSFSDLPWDPALGNVPEVSASGEVGTRAVHTAIATNSVVLFSKLIAFVYTGSASILSEAIHSIADLGNQCLLKLGIVQSQREADALHPYGYATERSGLPRFLLMSGSSVTIALPFRACQCLGWLILSHSDWGVRATGMYGHLSPELASSSSVAACQSITVHAQLL